MLFGLESLELNMIENIKGSVIWRSLMVGQKICSQGGSYLIGNVEILQNSGLIFGALHSLLAYGPPLHESDKTVSDFLLNQSWNLASIPYPTHFLVLLWTRFLYKYNDKFIWPNTSNGIFTTASASAYRFITSEVNLVWLQK